VKSYWDTSGAINAAMSPRVFSRLNTGKHVTRPHLMAEFFATMTGRGISFTDSTGAPGRFFLSPKDCAAWLTNFASRVQFEDLTPGEILQALGKTQSLGLQGARVHDYLHACAAQKAKADELLTRNPKHFQGLLSNVAWP